jgi:hypothetical protein
MKLIDICSLPEEEREAYVKKMYDLLDNKPVDEWVSRIKYLIGMCVPDRICGELNFTKGLLEFKNYSVTYNDGHLNEIKGWYRLYDAIECILSCSGFVVCFTLEHEGGEVLLKVDGLEEFVKLTEGYKD